MKTVTSLFLVCAGFTLAMPSRAGTLPTGTAVHVIPRMEDIVIDGHADDWHENGFVVDHWVPVTAVASTYMRARQPEAADLSIDVRLGWNPRGLLLLARFQDDRWIEEADESRLWRRDSLDLYMVDRCGGSNMVQWVIAPGCDPRFTTPRIHFYDHRRDERLRQTTTAPDLARIREGNTCTLEMLIPFENLGIAPSPGHELAMQLWINDIDLPAGAAPATLAWYPQLGAFKHSERTCRIVLGADAGVEQVPRRDDQDTAGSPVPEGMAFVPGRAVAWFGWPDYMSEVRVDAFFIDRFEVSESLWRNVFDWAVAHGYTFGHSGVAKGLDHPVHSINWFDCLKWANARSEKEGRKPAYYTSPDHRRVYRNGVLALNEADVDWKADGYRLPTDAEWEIAARGGVEGRLFPWGDTITHSNANYLSNGSLAYDLAEKRGAHPAYAIGEYPYTSPVGRFAPNDYGISDMSGNVFEWCWDMWYTRPTPDGAVNPKSGGGYFYGDNSQWRSIRGGSWLTWPSQCRSGDRRNARRDRVADDLGFRTVITVGSKDE